jgi:UDP-GlcNAc:undecaprenyl-phosphate GlcNAc-1-phosphate transferase
MWMIGLETFLASAVAAWLVTPLVVRLAARIGALDAPGPRKVHASPIPRIGGLSIVVGLAAGIAVAAVASGYVRHGGWSRASYWLGLGICACGMLALGLVDDLRRLSFRTKFAVQLVAGVAVWTAGFRIDALGWPGADSALQLGAWSLPLTLLWVVGVTNAFNLIDGLDGLAAGIALISTLTIAVVSLRTGHVAVSAMSVALAGSLFGFLPYNFNPARIFLGDSGSMFLGFCLALISIHGSQKNVTVVAILLPLLLLGYPILDTGIAIARRIGYIRSDAAGDGSLRFVVRNLGRVFLPDRGHLHHRLLEIGMSHRAAVLSLYACGIAFAGAALALVTLHSLGVALVVASTISVLTVALAGLLLVRARLVRRGRPDAEPATPPRAAGPVASGGALEQH